MHGPFHFQVYDLPNQGQQESRLLIRESILVVRSVHLAFHGEILIKGQQPDSALHFSRQVKTNATGPENMGVSKAIDNRLPESRLDDRRVEDELLRIYPSPPYPLCQFCASTKRIVRHPFAGPAFLQASRCDEEI